MKSPRRGRGALVVALAAALLMPSTSVAELNAVEDWSQHAVGSKGVPSGWRPYETFGGRPAYDFSVVNDEGRRALHLKSRDEHSTIAKEIRVSLRATPVLEWSWKVVQHPAGADIRKRETSDLTGHVFVVWPRFPGPLRTRLIGYAWDASLPAGSMERSRKAGNVMFVIVRSGTQELGRWVTERRNVYEDYRRAFGEDPEDPRAVAISIDTNDTHSTAEALVGRIAFTSGATGAALRRYLFASQFFTPCI
ncbi:MAG: hypothetical protein DME16_12020 [Candidatus Rokuibacteriota bacterium]|nr:MAG: hypothetical protein DME16_12020 [Candidatus Rokubacteria bacterium]